MPKGKDSVLIVGSGGREHALAWALAKSPHVGKVYCAPGNGGTACEDKCVNIPIYDAAHILDAAEEFNASLIIVGPEALLVRGIVDEFHKKNRRIFGPSAGAAMLEGSKAYAKRFMDEHGIPTARFKTFTDADEALRYVDSTNRPLFIKADGLAAGKGAMDGSTPDAARVAIRRAMIDKEFGEAGNEIVIEDYLCGEEASYMALVNSECGIAVPLLPSQDHKRLLDGDNGPNTGGMGAYTPTSLLTPELMKSIEREILNKTVRGLRERKLPLSYTGTLYPGIMVSDGNPFVLEYNVRFGDPETQAVLPMLKSDLYEAFTELLAGKAPNLEWSDGYAVCVVAASMGYPGKYETGKRIYGLNNCKDVRIFHAGTKNENGACYTNGGRVLGITGLGATVEQARNKAYAAFDDISFEGILFRTDIGNKEIGRKVMR